MRSPTCIYMDLWWIRGDLSIEMVIFTCRAVGTGSGYIDLNAKFDLTNNVLHCLLFYDPCDYPHFNSAVVCTAPLIATPNPDASHRIPRNIDNWGF